jgi:hypothetical protein
MAIATLVCPSDQTGDIATHAGTWKCCLRHCASLRRSIRLLAWDTPTMSAFVLCPTSATTAS